MALECHSKNRKSNRYSSRNESQFAICTPHLPRPHQMRACFSSALFLSFCLALQCGQFFFSSSPDLFVGFLNLILPSDGGSSESTLTVAAFASSSVRSPLFSTTTVGASSSASSLSSPPSDLLILASIPSGSLYPTFSFISLKNFGSCGFTNPTLFLPPPAVPPLPPPLIIFLGGNSFQICSLLRSVIKLFKL